MKRTTLWLWLIRFVGLIVPQRLRADWRQEWEAELQWREQQLAEWHKLDRQHKRELWRHSVGAFADALWLQPKRWEEDMWQDIRYGIRMMRKHKASTLIAILTLAFGIGANTTIFSAMESAILHPFALPHQDRLVTIYERKPEVGIARTGVTGAALQEWREQSRTFAEFVTRTGVDYELTGTDQAERVSGNSVSANYFAALGVQPLLGRTFHDGEDTAGREKVVVLKHGLWQRRFGADPNIIGQTITLNAKSYTVIGVMPEDFNFPYNGSELFTPFVFPTERRQDRENHSFQVMGLLQPGVTLEQGAAELRAFAERAQTMYPATNKGVEVVVVDLNYEYTRSTRMYMPFSLGAVLFVLLIACANVANLLLVRGSVRHKELAVRMAMGASRLRIVRQMLTESVLLSLLGGALGLGLAHIGLMALKNGVPQGIARHIAGWEHLGLNTWALGFTALASILTGVVFGVIPALQIGQATHTNFNDTLKEGGRSATSGVRNRLRNALVIAEIALSVVLLVGAGLVLRSFINLLNADLGFNPDNTMAMRISLSKERYAQPEQRLRFYQEMERRVAALPGVAQVGLGDTVMLWGSNEILFQIVGQSFAPANTQVLVEPHAASPGYFAALRTPLLTGRMFTAQDDGKVPVVVVNEAFARRFFPHRTAIGERLRIDGGPPTEIIGIVGNIINNDMDELPVAAAYQPLTQYDQHDVDLIVRGQSNQANQESVLHLAGAIRQELKALDPNMPQSAIIPILENVREYISPKRVVAVMLSIFALLALLMASVGLYAVMAFAVVQRTHEIGVRLALGARMSDVTTMIMRQGLWLVLSGVVIGLAGALAVSRILKQMLFGITATDPITFVLVATVLIVTAQLASWLPARRAAKVDPMIALRHD